MATDAPGSPSAPTPGLERVPATAYVLQTGEAGADRLALLEDLYGPATHALLAQIVQPGMTVIDVGCGTGTVTRVLAGLVGAEGVAVGIDQSADQLRLARDGSAHYWMGSAYHLGARSRAFDVVFARSLLSHLADPMLAVAELARLLRPGGTLILDDIDLTSIRTDPPSDAYERINELFSALVGGYGADDHTGSKLSSWLREAGLVGVAERSDQPILRSGDGKRYWEYTYLETVPAMLRAEVLDRSEANRLTEQIALISADPAVAIAQPRRTQAWGHKPG